MTFTDARRILGLGPDEDPCPHFAGLQAASERIAALVRGAPNEALGDRYQQMLIEFDQALAALREYWEESGLEPPPPPHAAASLAVIGEDEEIHEPRSPRPFSSSGWLLISLIGISGGAWLVWNYAQIQDEQRQTRIAFFERQGFSLIENRHWAEAEKVIREIEAIAPESALALRGRRSIEAGVAEEQTQFISYLTGQASAELEAGRLDEAIAAARQVLERFPRDPEASAILERAAAARAGQTAAAELAETAAEARDALDLREWDAAIASAGKLLALSPGYPAAAAILAEATAGREQATADKARALELLEMASARDQGQFDQQALDWIREARSLAPGHPEIAASFEKFSSYTRTIRVPGDFASPAEALAGARDRDRIVISAETWNGPLVVNASVEIEGAGPAKTIIECPAEGGSVITVGPAASGVRISGITFRHESFAIGAERFSVALVRGGGATFVDCRFMEASGHGLAVIEGGQASVSRCRFADNGWNGVAAIGPGTKLEMRDSEALLNFENGIESWQEATVVLVNNRCEGNSRNGIHTENGLAPATIEGNRLIDNREFGLVLSSAGGGKITGNTARGNSLGGFVIRATASVLPFRNNTATLNQGPGFVLEAGLVTASYSENASERNAGQQILVDTDLSPPAEKEEKEDPWETGEAENIETTR